ncbi:MAG: hypothetical protein KA354_21905 [Phycisphaerae bacterium]|nr:hypothetical protein [Phycisphaerae bacterium]
MQSTRRPAVVAAMILAMAAGHVPAADENALRGYPEPVPEDASFETVVNSQPFPRMKIPVPIIGAKVHPEEVHVTPSGGLIFPRRGQTEGPCVAILVGSRPNGEQGSGEANLALPPVEAVTSKLVEGYMPGVEHTWTMGDLQVRQVAFATQGGKFESSTANEPLIAMIRYTIANRSASGHEVVAAILFGEAPPDLSVKAVPPVRPEALSFEAPFVRGANGSTAACLLSQDLKVSFKPLPKGPDSSHCLLLNEKAETVKSPEYTVNIERRGDAIMIGPWHSPGGADVYVESFRGHSTPMAAGVEVVGQDGKAVSIGTLYRTTFSTDVRPVADFISPGQCSAVLPWARLAKVLPGGRSKLVTRCYYPVGNGRAVVGSWAPLIHFVRPGVTPRFQNSQLNYTDENRLRVEMALPAGETRTIDLAVPYDAHAPQAAAALAALRFDAELAAFRTFWEKELHRRAEFVIPESRIRDSYRACLANNLLLTDRDPKTGVLMPHPDANVYEAVWSGDSGVVIQAMDRMGYHQEAESMLDYFLARQGSAKPEGDVLSAEGFFCGDVDLRWMNQNGFILWAMSEHYKLTRDEVWLRKVAAQLIKGCDWIIRERARTKVVEDGRKPKHYGLLPKGRPSDLYIWDHWYWTDTYSYMGLRGTAEALAAIGLDSEAGRLAAEADDYKACIVDSVERSTDPAIKPPFVPPTPYRPGPPSLDFYNENWYTISSPIYMVEAGLLDPRGEKAAGINYWLEKCGLYSGLPAFMPGSIDPYYVYNQSLCQLLRGEAAKFAWTLYSMVAYAMGPGTYCTIEGHNLVTGLNGEAWSANRQPHMHSNSRYLDLVRIGLLLEEGDGLHLLAGAPRGWLADGQGIEVKRAPSYFGEVNYTVASRAAAGEVVFRIEPTRWQAANLVLHVRPPTQYGRIQAVTVNGKDWKAFDGTRVYLGKQTAATEVVCRLGTGS